MPTNIDKLHEYFLGKEDIGHTTAICHTTAGLVELFSDLVIILVVDNFQRANNLRWKLLEVFKEHELEIKGNSRFFTTENNNLIKITLREEKRRTILTSGQFLVILVD